MRLIGDNLIVDERDCCYDCSRCYLCDSQLKFYNSLKTLDNNQDAGYTINSCSSFLPIQSDRPTGTINEIRKWRKL